MKPRQQIKIVYNGEVLLELDSDDGEFELETTWDIEGLDPLADDITAKRREQETYKATLNITNV